MLQGLSERAQPGQGDRRNQEADGRAPTLSRAILGHVGFPVSDFARSRTFYEKALALLGYKIIMEVTPEQTGSEGHAGFGVDGKPCLWIGTGAALTGRLHVALVAKDRAAVDAFYQAAIAAGGKDNGAPGLRPHYHHPNYYGAFVLNPDGHNIEAVCHRPARARASARRPPK